MKHFLGKKKIKWLKKGRKFVTKKLDAHVRLSIPWYQPRSDSKKKNKTNTYFFSFYEPTSLAGHMSLMHKETTPSRLSLRVTGPPTLREIGSRRVLNVGRWFRYQMEATAALIKMGNLLGGPMTKSRNFRGETLFFRNLLQNFKNKKKPGWLQRVDHFFCIHSIVCLFLKCIAFFVHKNLLRLLFPTFWIFC